MAKLTKEQEEELRNWVIKDLWPQYPSDYGVKGSRAKLIKYVISKSPNEEERKEIVLSLKAQKKESQLKKSQGEFIRWPHASTWFNEERYTDVIESAVEIKSRSETKQCSKCERPTHGPKFEYCTDHFYESVDPWKERRKAKGIELGLMPNEGETKSEWAMRCRAMAKPVLSALLNRSLEKA